MKIRHCVPWMPRREMDRRFVYLLCIILFCIFSTLFSPLILEKSSTPKGLLIQDEEDNACRWPRFDQQSNVMALDKIRCDTGFPGPLVFVDESGYLKVDEESMARLTYLSGQAIKCKYAYFDCPPSDKDEIIFTGQLDFYSSDARSERKAVRLIHGDFVNVQCYQGDQKSLIYSNVYSYGTLKNKRRSAKFKRYSGIGQYSVMIIVLDGVSLKAFQRHMPSSFEYLKSILGASVFPGFTKVAADSNGNIMAMLTGELRSSNTTGFIWNEFPGYATSFHEDSVENGFFSQRKFDHSEKPTDFYYRPFYKELAKLRPNHPECAAHRILVETTMDAIQRQMIVLNDTLQFNVVHIGQMIRNKVANLEYLDSPFFGFLRRMHDMVTWERTVLFVVGSRGPNSGRSRESVEGVFEERMPLLILRVPKRFHDEDPGLHGRLVENQRRLVTPFDVHATIRHVMNMGKRQEEGKRKKFGISLFKSIGGRRMCKEAGIPDQFCPCQTFQPLDPRLDIIQRAGHTLVAHVNHILATHKVSDGNGSVVASSLCWKFSLTRVIRSERFSIGDSGRSRNRLRVLIECYPGEALFEAEMVQKTPKKWTVVSHVTQLNRQNQFSKCIQDEKIKPFCICNGPPK